MHSYPGKLLELLYVENESANPCIGVRLTFEQPIELKWSLDPFTADQIKAVTENAGTYKYRISFRSFWNSSQQCPYSSLTRSYRDHSETIYFACSESYTGQLQSIKELARLSDLHDLSSFITSVSEPTKNLEKEKVVRSRSWVKFSRVAVTLGLIAFALLADFPRYMHTGVNVFANVMTTAATPAVPDSTVLQQTAGQEEGKEAPADPAALETPAEPAPPALSSSPADEQPSASANVAQTKEEVPVSPSVPAVALEKAITYSLSADAVALTFDDGPSKYTKAIVDTLKEHEAGGTFFFIGQNVKQYPENVKYVHSNGYSIGNHTMTHANLPKLSAKEQEQEISSTNEAIERLTSQPVLLFRPPYGAKNKDLQDILEIRKMRMVLWNRDTEDWKSKNTGAIVRYVRDTPSAGSVILLHESKETLDALPEIIRYLQEQDLRIVGLR